MMSGSIVLRMERACVKDYTAGELQRFNAAKLFPHITEFQHIPTFDEYCSWAKAGGH